MDARISSLNGGTFPAQGEISRRETITRTRELEVPAKISRITIMRCGHDAGRTGGRRAARGIEGLLLLGALFSYSRRKIAAIKNAHASGGKNFSESLCKGNIHCAHNSPATLHFNNTRKDSQN